MLAEYTILIWTLHVMHVQLLHHKDFSWIVISLGWKLFMPAGHYSAVYGIFSCLRVNAWQLFLLVCSHLHLIIFTFMNQNVSL